MHTGGADEFARRPTVKRRFMRSVSPAFGWMLRRSPMSRSTEFVNPLQDWRGKVRLGLCIHRPPDRSATGETHPPGGAGQRMV